MLISCKAVAVNFDVSEVVVATRFLQLIGIDISRGGCRFFQRHLIDRDSVGSPEAGSFSHLSGLAVAGGC